MKRLAVVAFTLLTAFTVWLVIAPPPDRRSVKHFLETRSDHFEHTLHAYEVLDGVPYVLYHVYLDGRSKLYFTHLDRGWSGRPIFWWRVAKTEGFIYYTGEAASLGIAACPSHGVQACQVDTTVFGQVNDRAITALELSFGAERRQYPVAFPGFIIRLEGVHGEPTDYRWMDGEDQVVWTREQALSPNRVRHPHAAILGSKTS